MFAFDDSKTIFLRGRNDDLQQVENIIAEFDRPAPQARLSLWTIELNSDATRSGAEKLNQTLKIIEEELARTRAQLAGSITVLRDSVLRTVEKDANPGLYLHSRTDLPEKTLGQFRKVAFFDHGLQTSMRSAVNYLPDPAVVTTLGETLVAMALARPDARSEIATHFHNALLETIPELRNQDNGIDGTGLFSSTLRAMGFDGRDRQDYSPQNPQLAELGQAFRQALMRMYLDRLQAYLRDAEDLHHKLDPNVANNPHGSAKENQLKLRHDAIIARLANLLKDLHDRDILNRDERDSCTKYFGKWAWDPDNIDDKTHAYAQDAISCLRQYYPAQLANAREAAANEMLKQIIVAFEDDLDRHFIRPMLEQVRKRVNSKGVGVGVIQRTSLVATNRLLARVDPRASAQLGLGEEQDILGGIQQLAQLFTAAQTAGPLGLISGLQALPRNPPPELFAVNTGAEFRVTPIFDPSGQALRFKLDYVAANRIQQPIGSTTQELPHIERHTINTEVQLSNMELREITRFEANAALGIPTTKSGGIPLLNEIPFVKEVPLIGYFVRKAGRNAVMQESIIFGQTTTYPTISDLLDLEISSSDNDQGPADSHNKNLQKSSNRISEPAADPTAGNAASEPQVANSQGKPH